METPRRSGDRLMDPGVYMELWTQVSSVHLTGQDKTVPSLLLLAFVKDLISNVFYRWHFQLLVYSFLKAGTQNSGFSIFISLLVSLALLQSTFLAFDHARSI